jgi:hypothetical protein
VIVMVAVVLAAVMVLVAVAVVLAAVMHPHRMDDRGSAKHLGATKGVSTHIQEHGTRQLPLWPVVVSSRCLRLASAPPWERLPEISKSHLFITIGYPLAIRALAVFAFSAIGNDIAVARVWHGDVHWVHG